MRIGVLGANGQVGSEVCLLLRRAPGVEVVPVCRNLSGSAFLRWHGMACRHGLPTDPGQARALLSDCELVANFALAVGRPGEARAANRRLIDNAAAASAPGARVVYFSTLSVHRRHRPAEAPAGRSAYGREKLRCERDALRAGRRSGRDTWVLRLGHVCGELQGIGHELRALVAAGPVAVPRGGTLGSNVTHTVTIADAILKIAQGQEAPGLYDLLNAPPWTWGEVLAWEAAEAGLSLVMEPSAARVPGPRAWARRAAAGLLSHPRARELGLTLLAGLPEGASARAQARHFQRRAAAEIAALRGHPLSHPAFSFPPVHPRPLATLAPTAELLRAGLGRIPPAERSSLA